MTWKIEVCDLLVKQVEIEAETREEALEKAKTQIILDPKPKMEGGDRIKRKMRAYNRFAFIAKHENKESSEEEFLVLNENGELGLSDRGTEFDEIESCRSNMMRLDNDRRKWKIIRLKRM